MIKFYSNFDENRGDNVFMRGQLEHLLALAYGNKIGRMHGVYRSTKEITNCYRDKNNYIDYAEKTCVHTFFSTFLYCSNNTSLILTCYFMTP